MSVPNGVNNGTGDSASPPEIETDLLIVGTGPAGGALAAFLASYGQSFHFRMREQSVNAFQD